MLREGLEFFKPLILKGGLKKEEKKYFSGSPDFYPIPCSMLPIPALRSLIGE